jgi:hypothetical protein
MQFGSRHNGVQQGCSARMRWAGTLIGSVRDAIRQLYVWHRYYDPSRSALRRRIRLAMPAGSTYHDFGNDDPGMCTAGELAVSQKMEIGTGAANRLLPFHRKAPARSSVSLGGRAGHASIGSPDPCWSLSEEPGVIECSQGGRRRRLNRGDGSKPGSTCRS